MPVVYGGNLSQLQLPEDSYINALDFATSKDLADHILYLDSNDDAYNEYFQYVTYFIYEIHIDI